LNVLLAASPLPFEIVPGRIADTVCIILVFYPGDWLIGIAFAVPADLAATVMLFSGFGDSTPELPIDFWLEGCYPPRTHKGLPSKR
jgi:hypothetical protein